MLDGAGKVTFFNTTGQSTKTIIFEWFHEHGNAAQGLFKRVQTHFGPYIVALNKTK